MRACSTAGGAVFFIPETIKRKYPEKKAETQEKPLTGKKKAGILKRLLRSQKAA